MPIASPCISICIVDGDSVCIGCRRTLGEIACWSRASEAQKQSIIDAGRTRGVVAAISMRTIRSQVDAIQVPHNYGDAWKELVVELCRIQNSLKPQVAPRTEVAFTDGLSQTPSPMTHKDRFSGVFANATPIDVQSSRAAMKRSHFMAAWKIGIGQSDCVACDGGKIVAAKTASNSNDSSAVSLISILCHVESNTCDSRVERARLFRDRADWKGLATEMATFQIIAMAGFFVRSGQQGMVIVIDNVVSAAAALLAERIYPGAARMMIATTLPGVPSHELALAALNLRPIAIGSHQLSAMLDSVAECMVARSST